MRNIWTIARREYRQYFISPLAYVTALAILLVVGAYFSLYLYFVSQQSLFGAQAPETNIVVGPMATIFLLGIPALTMRLLADEQRMGTLELLLTAPVRDAELVIGKWLGAFLFALTIIAITFIFPVILNALVDPGIDQGIMISGYLGIILMVAALLALGTAISALFSNQFAAFFVTLGLMLFLWWVIGWPASVFQYGAPHDIFEHLNISKHFGDMTGGNVTLAAIVYFLSLTILGLLVGTTAVETRRWR
jgi:ABC-2 type transport system permease protein